MPAGRSVRGPGHLRLPAQRAGPRWSPAISIPLSIFLAIAIFGVAGLTINIMTLGGLAVAVGRVVDDSIVVLENIYRHRGLGDSVHDSVITGTKEVAGAITSSTITTVAVFLPIGLVGGIVSQFFLPFGLAVTFALLPRCWWR